MKPNVLFEGILKCENDLDWKINSKSVFDNEGVMPNWGNHTVISMVNKPLMTTRRQREKPSCSVYVSVYPGTQCSVSQPITPLAVY